ncbi:hypothetical protein ACLB2K_039316 [Fragaria x ananassa]
MELVDRRPDYLAMVKDYQCDIGKVLLQAPQEGTMRDDMVNEVNKRNDAFKEQHPDATEEEIMESVQSQQIEMLVRCSKLINERRSEGWDEEASET